MQMMQMDGNIESDENDETPRPHKRVTAHEVQSDDIESFATPVVLAGKYRAVNKTEDTDSDSEDSGNMQKGRKRQEVRLTFCSTIVQVDHDNQSFKSVSSDMYASVYLSHARFAHPHLLVMQQ